MRSRTGCLTCRHRKLKCDEIKPLCGQCRKKSRECVPCDGVVFRHQQNASMNDEASGSHLGGFYAYKDSFDESQTWLDIPRMVTFVHVHDPYDAESTPEAWQTTDISAESSSETNVALYNDTSIIDEQLGDMDDVAVTEPLQSTPEAAALNSRPLNSTENSNVYQSPSSYVGDSTEAATPGIFPSNEDLSSAKTLTQSGYIPENSPLSVFATAIRSPSTASGSRQCMYSLKTRSETVEEYQSAFLLRHFSETIGLWMDVFDLDRYFSWYVPVQAVSKPILLHAICACAAKQLGRTRRRKTTNTPFIEVPSSTDNQDNSGDVDWTWHAADHYDKAVKLLIEALSLLQSTSIADSATSGLQWHSSPGLQRAHSGIPERRPSRGRRSNNSLVDDILTTTAMLCQYEHLDNTHAAFAEHLSGIKGLLDLVYSAGMMATESHVSTEVSSSPQMLNSKPRRSAFWCFARQDFFAAFINEKQTRINTYDLTIWRNAGLLVDDDGLVLPSNRAMNNLADGNDVMREDMICCALLLILSNVVNYMASGDSIDSVFPQDPASPTGALGINQMTLLEVWRRLETELDIWFEGLPDTFKPTSRYEVPDNENYGVDEKPTPSLPRLWFSIPMCATIMQAYHMTRILLLVNRPQESTARRSTLATRLRSYRSIEAEVRLHSHEICGISLGNRDSSVRVHMVQPLFVAGQCLTDPRERGLIIDLLRGVETDLGWATEQRVQQLLNEWAQEEFA